MPLAELDEVLRLHGRWRRGQEGGRRADLTRADLRGARLAGADLGGAVLTEADLTAADLREANLRSADMAGAVLRNADLCEAVVREAKLHNADMYGAVLDGADLRAAWLPRADLRRASLFYTNLVNADLFEADLTGADLTGADLTGADLTSAKLSLAAVDMAHGADLRGAVGRSSAPPRSRGVKRVGKGRRKPSKKAQKAPPPLSKRFKNLEMDDVPASATPLVVPVSKRFKNLELPGPPPRRIRPRDNEGVGRDIGVATLAEQTAERYARVAAGLRGVGESVRLGRMSPPAGYDVILDTVYGGYSEFERTTDRVDFARANCSCPSRKNRVRRNLDMRPQIGGTRVESRLRGAQAQRVAERLLEFHSRGVREFFSFPFEQIAPDVVYSVGEPVHVRYYSDKDDPETRDKRENRGLSADPDGVQGIWKHFIHGHDQGFGLQLYAPKTYVREAVGGHGRVWEGQALDMRGQWPEAVGWLGEMTEVVFEPAGSGQSRKLRPKRWMLWMFPDTDLLLALPHPVRDASKFLLWKGGNLTVTYRGIQG